MRISRRLAAGLTVSALVAAGGLTVGLVLGPVAHANQQAPCDSTVSTAGVISCTLPNSTNPDTTVNTPSAVQAVVTLQTSDGVTPADMYISVTYNMTCSQGTNSATTTNTIPSTSALPADQAITTAAPVTDNLALGEPTPDNCVVNSLTATLLASTDGTKFGNPTKGSFIMDLDWTPAASPSSSSATPTSTTSSSAPPPTTHVSLVKGYGGKCLDDSGNSSKNRTAVILWSCNSSDGAQGWTYANGELVHNGKCANVQGNGGNGTHIILWNCNGAANEKWFHSSSNGEFVLNSTTHGLMCMDDPGYSKTNGTKVIVWACHNTGNQHWS